MRMVFPRPETLFDRLAAGLPPLPVWAAGEVAGAALLGGTAAVAFHHAWVGAGLLLVGFAADGVGQALARRDSRAATPLLPFGVMLALFGFGLADPARALAAMFLMFALSVFTLLSGPRIRLIHWLAAMGLLAACFLSDRFSLLAYIIGIACFVKAGQGLAVRS
jgi:hypothetical protein